MKLCGFLALAFILNLTYCQGFLIHENIGSQDLSKEAKIPYEVEYWARNYLKSFIGAVHQRGKIVNWFVPEFFFEYCNGLNVTREEASQALLALPAGSSIQTTLNDAWFDQYDFIEIRFKFYIQFPDTTC